MAQALGCELGVSPPPATATTTITTTAAAAAAHPDQTRPDQTINPWIQVEPVARALGCELGVRLAREAAAADAVAGGDFDASAAYVCAAGARSQTLRDITGGTHSTSHTVIWRGADTSAATAAPPLRAQPDSTTTTLHDKNLHDTKNSTTTKLHDNKTPGQQNLYTVSTGLLVPAPVRAEGEARPCCPSISPHLCEHCHSESE